MRTGIVNAQLSAAMCHCASMFNGKRHCQHVRSDYHNPACALSRDGYTREQQWQIKQLITLRRMELKKWEMSFSQCCLERSEIADSLG
jgi:hypothetical protein